jgi:hypothetical protein
MNDRNRTRTRVETLRGLRSSRASLRAIVAGSLVGCVGCDSAVHVSPDMGRLDTELFARSRVLWPIVDGVAEVSVCWGQPRFETTYPVASLRPDLEALLPERKRWIRDIVEEQWNGRTPLRFSGWDDCSAGAADVELTPIDTGVTSSCADGSLGQPCVDALGHDLADGGGGVFLNVFFGEEVLYSSRYQQDNPGAEYDERNEPNSNRAYPYWLPQACFDEFQYAWSTNNSLTRYPVDINEPAILAKFTAIYENCLKFNALHEFGHIAGFSHEQQRVDVPAGCDAERDPGVQYVGDTPLGPFDVQSIMSYCRTDDAATLSEQDAEQANLVYLGYVPDSHGLGDSADEDSDAVGSNAPPVAAPGGLSGTSAMAGASGAASANAATCDIDVAGESAAGSGNATAGARVPGGGTGGSSPVPVVAAAPAVSSAGAQPSEGGCNMSIPPARDGHWYAAAISALFVAVRSRRAWRSGVGAV